MEVVNPRSALLCNYEVLTLLRDLESDQLARSKTALRIKKEEESAGTQGSSVTLNPSLEDVSENLRTVQVEAIQYLSADFQPTSAQSPDGITQLIKNIGSYDMTKAEKLQVVNLAPTEAVELYVIVEELEDRLGDRMDEILTHVRTSLSDRPAQPPAPSAESVALEFVHLASAEQDIWNLNDIDAEGEEIDFDDTGEGAGVEGDLDIDDD